MTEIRSAKHTANVVF